ncbi:MAG: tetratricopeptide repeat protein, partial [Diaphorobacter nitroreducens]
HAHRLAPENTAIALHLAQAYQRFGQPARAAALLRAQRSRHPGDERIAQALRELQPPPAPVQESATVVAQPEAAPAAPVLAAAPSATAPEPASEHGTPAAAPAIAAPPDQLAKPAPAVRAQRRMAQVPRPRRADGAPGYAAASRAYEAVERAELPAALTWAREAAQAAPANADYQRLLTYLLIENGLYEEAQAKAQEAELTFAPQGDTQWQALGDTARQRHAYAQFEAASQAQRQGRASDALAHAQAAAEQAPGVPAYRLQWVGLLLAEGRHAQAQQVAERGLAQGDGAALQVLRGAALQAQGQTDDAARVFDGVIGRPDLAPHEQQNYRVIAADAAFAARQPERAKALLQPLAQGGAVDVSGREAEIRAATRRPISAASLQTFSLRLPVVNCFGSAQAPGCEVWPGQDAPDPARAVAQEAFRAYTERDYGLAAAKAEEAARLQPAHLPYRLLRLQALVAAGQVEQALREADDTLQSRADGAEVLALRSRVY